MRVGKSVAWVHLKVTGVEDLSVNTSAAEFSQRENVVLQRRMWAHLLHHCLHSYKTSGSATLKIQIPSVNSPLSVFQNTSLSGNVGVGEGVVRLLPDLQVTAARECALRAEGTRKCSVS